MFLRFRRVCFQDFLVSTFFRLFRVWLNYSSCSLFFGNKSATCKCQFKKKNTFLFIINFLWIMDLTTRKKKWQLTVHAKLIIYIIQFYSWIRIIWMDIWICKTQFIEYKSLKQVPKLFMFQYPKYPLSCLIFWKKQKKNPQKSE